MRNVQYPAIAPSILTADLGHLEQEIQSVEAAGVDMIHLDVMDGHFVPNISIGVPVVAAVRQMTSLPLDVHLMIERPEQYVQPFIDAGADLVSIHIEATPHVHRTIQAIKSAGAQAGVALNPATPLSMVEEILGLADFILVMSVNPGFGGQSFIESSLEKIQRLHTICESRSLETRIEVDGGIKSENIASVVRAGASMIVAGSSIFNPDVPVDRAVPELRAAIDR